MANAFASLTSLEMRNSVCSPTMSSSKIWIKKLKNPSCCRFVFFSGSGKKVDTRSKLHRLYNSPAVDFCSNIESARSQFQSHRPTVAQETNLHNGLAPAGAIYDSRIGFEHQMRPRTRIDGVWQTIKKLQFFCYIAVKGGLQDSWTCCTVSIINFLFAHFLAEYSDIIRIGIPVDR